MKKKLSIVGLIIGFAFVVVGILAMTGALGGNTSSPGYAPSMYDSGYASFGADYYTYSVNNSAEAASGARTAAYNIADVAEFLLLFFGLSSILFGLMVMCGFGILLFSCSETNKPKSVCEANSSVVDVATTEEVSA